MSSKWEIDGPLPEFYDDPDDVELVVIRRDSNLEIYKSPVYHELQDDDNHRTKCGRPRKNGVTRLRRIRKSELDDDRRLCKDCGPSETPERSADPADAINLATKLDRMKPDDVSGVGGRL